jgi:hypothetical protein
MKFVAGDTTLSPAADEIKALILQAFNVRIGHSTNLHYEEKIHFAISVL